MLYQTFARTVSGNGTRAGRPTTNSPGINRDPTIPQLKRVPRHLQLRMAEVVVKPERTSRWSGTGHDAHLSRNIRAQAFSCFSPMVSTRELSCKRSGFTPDVRPHRERVVGPPALMRLDPDQIEGRRYARSFFPETGRPLRSRTTHSVGRAVRSFIQTCMLERTAWCSLPRLEGSLRRFRWDLPGGASRGTCIVPSVPCSLECLSVQGCSVVHIAIAGPPHGAGWARPWVNVPARFCFGCTLVAVDLFVPGGGRSIRTRLETRRIRLFPARSFARAARLRSTR